MLRGSFTSLVAVFLLSAVSGTEEGSTGDSEFNEFQLSALKHMNMYRKRHAAPPLTLNAELCAKAQEHAQNIADGKAEYDQPLGEEELKGDNEILLDSFVDISAKEAIDEWYLAACYGYDFGEDSEVLEDDIKAFTQMVWVGSTEVGLAKVAGSDDQGLLVSVVGRFRKGGNIKGQYLKNVKKGTFNEEKHCDNFWS